MFVGFNLCAVEAQEVLIFVDYSVLFNELDLFKKIYNNALYICTSVHRKNCGYLCI